MYPNCKCHGMSGSCSVKTCYNKMKTFRAIGNLLSDKFEQAKEVLTSNDGSYSLSTEFSFADSQNRINSPRRRSLHEEDLIFTDRSPDFCTRTDRRRQGVLSPKGRICNVTQNSEGNCKYLCCNRGHSAVHHVKEYNCQCSFKWCCRVTCKVCNITNTEHRCT